MRAILRCLLGLFLFVAVVPSAVYAQATIAGQVKDSSGAVLPGATVEAASPALIERTRSAVTDGNGQYKIVDLRPGSYVVTFTLSGFSTIKRDGIEIVGGATVTVNADLKVGAVEETITVSGEAPTVDVQNATGQKAFTHEVIDNIPSSRNVGGIGNMLLGVTSSLTGQDVGGSNSAAFTLALHGVADQRVMVNGANTGSLQNGQVGQNIPNTATAQEVTFDFGAVSAELPTGGVRVNFIPRDGGNTFKGFAFGAFTNHSLQGNDLTQELQNRGLTAATSTKENADLSGGFGGPIVKDKFWFFGTARRRGGRLLQHQRGQSECVDVCTGYEPARLQRH